MSQLKLNRAKICIYDRPSRISTAHPHSIISLNKFSNFRLHYIRVSDNISETFKSSPARLVRMVIEYARTCLSLPTFMQPAVKVFFCAKQGVIDEL